jgi:Cu-Zn family superoxide dismutase
MKAMMVVALIVVLAGCRAMSPSQATDNTATAELKDASGRSIGTAMLTQVGSGVRMVVEVRGLPAGEKGVHIHAVGKCEPPSFESAGPHFNPTGRQHGTLNPQGPHAGDLPNITIAADGGGRMETLTDRVTLREGVTSVFDADGSALVIHAAADDHRTDPTGNSGARLVCGLITKPPTGGRASGGGRPTGY